MGDGVSGGVAITRPMVAEKDRDESLAWLGDAAVGAPP